MLDEMRWVVIIIHAVVTMNVFMAIYPIVVLIKGVLTGQLACLCIQQWYYQITRMEVTNYSYSHYCNEVIFWMVYLYIYKKQRKKKNLCSMHRSGEVTTLTKQ